MTRDDLNKCLELHKRLDDAYNILEALEAKAGLNGSALDGMPHGTDVSDKVGNIAIAIADMKTLIDELEDQAAVNDAAVMEFSKTFRDDRLRVAIQMRFISGFTWSEVSEILGGVSEDTLRRNTYKAVSAGKRS